MASKGQLEKFQEDGYLVLENFITEDDAEALKKDCHQLVEDMNPAEHNTVFSTTKQNGRNDYFLNSGDKIAFFFEEDALDEKGNLQVPKQKSLNKIGHALHVLCPNFKRITFDTKVQELLKSFKYEEPVCCQSMYIFKQPGIGGQVIPHQDATFLSTEPSQTALGIWIALEDATLENGCLWFIPGSHKGGLYNDYKMVRDVRPDSSVHTTFTAEKPDYDSMGEYKAVPIKKGSAIVIDGLVIHKSEHNKSDKSRHIYTYHVFDQKAGKWSDRNWLQPTKSCPFTPVYGS